MRSKILIILIVIISFASAHDLFINHFEPSKTTVSKATIATHVDSTIEVNTYSFHHSFHTDAIFYSEYIFDTITPQAQILSPKNTISYNLQSKQIKPPIA